MMKKGKIPLNLMNTAQIIVIVFLLSGFAGAQDYSLEFSQIGISGGVSQTADYQVLDIITDLGTSGGSQSSASYAFTPVFGFEEALTSVKCWMLYE